MSVNLTLRDRELLRTLVRVQFANTRSLQSVFFNTLHLARKRLNLLRNAGYIVTHTKGLPGLHATSGSRYWRITTEGLAKFEQLFPHERIPENLVSRVSRASLLMHLHRDDMTNAYLALIASQDRHQAEISERANIVDWRGEHEVVLGYQAVDGAKFVPRQIIPDATLTTSQARYFVEVDRSTEPGKRIRRVLTSYASAFKHPSYAELFPDGCAPEVVYVTKSASRAKNLRQTIASLELPFPAHALAFTEALALLNAAVSGEPPPAPRQDVEALLHNTGSLLLTFYNACLTHITPEAAPAVYSALRPVLVEVHDHMEVLRKGPQ
tara:strand:- start:107 stop:1078 length:972 start_codon:yes stop_codon:yes gene_type:complete